jgi:RND family efflux transporter MFP subunit
MKSFNSIVVVFAIYILLSGCSSKSVEKNNSKFEEAIPVQLQELKKSESVNKIFVSGAFTTDDETLLSFKTGGVISAIYVNEGDKISKGQLLASLDVTEISAAVQQTQLALDKASRDFQRAQNLFNDSVASLEQLQNAETAKDIANRQLTTAQFNLTFSQIRAKSDGVVLRKLANTGQITGQGVPVIQTSSKGSVDWILKATVSDQQWSEIQISDSVNISADVFDPEIQQGIVSSKSENTDPYTGSFSVSIKIRNAKKLNLASGMFGKAEILTSKKKLGWVIPYEALLDGNGTEGYVFVTNDKKSAVKAPVKIVSLDKNSAVISTGLEDFKFLITSGNAYLSDKSIITVK